MTDATGGKGTQPPAALAKDILVGIALALLATAVRAMLDPLLHNKFPFAICFYAVLAAAWWRGTFAGLAAATVGILFSVVLWVEPRGSLAISDADDVIGLLFIAIASCVLSLLGGLRLEAERRAKAALEESHRSATMLLENERQLRQKVNELNKLVEILPVGVWIADRECKHIAGNRAAYEAFGLPQGINVSLSVPPDDAMKDVKCYVNGAEITSADDLPMQRVARTGVALDKIEHDLVFPNGDRRTVYASIAPVLDEQGKVLLVIGAYADITDRKKGEESLRVAHEQLRSREASLAEAVRTAQDATRAKDEFLAIVSHELRTPLSAMLGWVRLIQGGKIDVGQARRGLLVIERNINVQTQLIEDLLDISRIVAGKMNLNIRPANLEKVVAAAIESVRPAADAKSIQVKADLKPIWISADSDRLQQVVWNLLSNALKFSDKGGSVNVRLEQTASQVRIVVSDSGRGIPPEFLPQLFSRFSQEDASTSRQQGGLGLGLAIAKHLVEAHGGRVFAESEGVGRGATFTVALPVPAFLNVPLEEEATGLQAEYNTSLGGIRVLFVDDEADAREMFDAIVKEKGGVVSTASSASDALLAMESFKPDVLVSDIGMPGIDGYAFIRKVRNMENASLKNLPAIALTAYARDDDRWRAIEAGFQAHEQKPVEPGRLVALISRLAKSV